MCVVVGMVVVARNSASGGAGAAWAALAILLCAGVPMAYIAKGVKAGNGATTMSAAGNSEPSRCSSHWIGRHRQRTAHPRGRAAALIALVLSQLAGLLVVLVITRFWKVSIHCATAGGLLGVFLALFGPWALLGIAPLALIAWSRVVLDAHTWTQVAVGAGMGFLIGSTLFPLLA